MANPIFEREENRLANEYVVNTGEIMTVNGTLQVTAFLSLILLLCAAFAWTRFNTDLGMLLMGGGALVGFILAIIICFTKNKYLVPIYAACEGFFLGGVSAYFETMYQGIVMQAVAGTFAALFSMLVLYRAGLIKCTEKFRSVIFISTASILVIYLVDFIGHFFGYAVPVINTSSTLGIGFSVLVVAIAALNLIIDFDFIEKGAQRMLPKDYEWYGAFGLMVTIVWLYVEVLKLLAKVRNR